MEKLYIFKYTCTSIFSFTVRFRHNWRKPRRHTAECRLFSTVAATSSSCAPSLQRCCHRARPFQPVSMESWLKPPQCMTKLPTGLHDIICGYIQEPRPRLCKTLLAATPRKLSISNQVLASLSKISWVILLTDDRHTGAITSPPAGWFISLAGVIYKSQVGKQSKCQI